MVVHHATSITNLRGQYEEVYDKYALSKDVIESIVDEFAMSASWLKGVTPTDVILEARILKKTLTFSSNYERNSNESS